MSFDSSAAFVEAIESFDLAQPQAMPDFTGPLRVQSAVSVFERVATNAQFLYDHTSNQFPTMSTGLQIDSLVIETTIKGLREPWTSKLSQFCDSGA